MALRKGRSSIATSKAGFCFTRGPDGQQIPVSEGHDNDLNIAYRLKNGWQHVLVGWADRNQLTPKAVKLQSIYGNDVYPSKTNHV
jgi:hypothetical protein